MKDVLSVENMRKSDALCIGRGTPSRELMLRAGRAVFDAVPWRGPVAVVCGTGNNAGDGYVIADLLRKDGVAVTLFLTGERFSPDGRYFYDAAVSDGVPVCRITEDTDLSGFRTVVDCVFGTGFRGTPSGVFADAIRAINESGAYVASVDINSGLDGDSGLAELAVRSNITVSVGGYKTGHFLNMAKDLVGSLVNCDIGIEPADRPARLIEREDVAPLFASRKNYSHKGTYGYVALVGGSVRYSGAIRLAAASNAAMRSGVGVVKLAVPSSVVPTVAPAVLESTVFPLSDRDGQIAFCEDEFRELIAGTSAVAFGMGIGRGKETRDALVFLLENFGGDLIVDADGLNELAGLDRDIVAGTGCRLILTPHAKEFSRLSGLSVGEILSAPVASAEKYASKTGAVVLLKGPSTVVTDGGTTYIVDSGCPGMATAGSGDVLSGILAAVLPRSEDKLLAAAAGAYVNGLSGERAQKKYGSVAMVAGDTVASVASVVKDLELFSETFV